MAKRSTRGNAFSHASTGWFPEAVSKKTSSILAWVILNLNYLWFMYHKW
jgi:hypothetical protein